MTAHYTTEEAAMQAISNQTGEGDVVMLKQIHGAELEASARIKANALNLRLAVVHLAPEWPALVRYRFYGNGLNPSVVVE